jgi:5-methylcytosine-specific restriction endonuclease McrA
MSKKIKEKTKDETKENKQLEDRKTYHKKYLKSKEFKAVKEYVLARDGYKCQVCGRTQEEGTLVCHHRCYRHLGEANLAECEDCVTLCQICHVAHHRQPINRWWYNIENPRNQPI